MWTSEPEVKIIADSQYHFGTRLTTFQVKYWRPILSEVNTHRAFSRNAASSRAMSFTKRCDQVRENLFVPAHWNAEQKGMIGGDEFSDDVKEIINADIQKLANATANYLEELNGKIERITGKSIHKQYLNRYLEPFVPVTQLISATDWDNFFDLRIKPDAQPEIYDVARKMNELLTTNTPHNLDFNQWHLPYVTDSEFDEYGLVIARKISVARCARVSYRAYDGNTKLENDLALYERLLKGKHMSPFEHVATPTEDERLWANYRGWAQFRSFVETLKAP